MKTVTDCFQRESMDLRRLSLPCLSPKQVNILVKCRSEAYIKSSIYPKLKSEAAKRAKDFKDCVQEAERD